MAKKPPSQKTKTKPTTIRIDVRRIPDAVVNQTVMAAILGITTRRLRQLEKEEQVVIPDKPGSFQVGRSVQAYVAYRAEGAVKKSGSTSMDALRDEKTKTERMNRAIKERTLIPLDEALATHQELIGMFTGYLTGLPAEIAKDVRERRRLEEIIDAGKQRLVDRLAKRLEAARNSDQTADAEAED